MTKIYLVYAQGCESNGKLDISSKKYVMEVFSNKRLAQKYANYKNQEWRTGYQRNADYKKEMIQFHFVETRVINRRDYSKIQF